MKTENPSKQTVKYIVKEKRILKEVKWGVIWRLNMKSESNYRKSSIVLRERHKKKVVNLVKKIIRKKELGHISVKTA